MGKKQEKDCEVNKKQFEEISKQFEQADKIQKAFVEQARGIFGERPEIVRVEKKVEKELKKLEEARAKAMELLGDITEEQVEIQVLKYTKKKHELEDKIKGQEKRRKQIKHMLQTRHDWLEREKD